MKQADVLGFEPTQSIIQGIDRLVGDKILVKPRVKLATASGILLGEQEEVMFGTVYAVGSGWWRVVKVEGGQVVQESLPMLVQAGMRIVHDRYGGSPVFANGEKWLLLKQDEVYGFFKDGWDIESAEMFNHRVLIDWDAQASLFPGTLIARPDTDIERYFTGRITAIGTLCRDLTVGKRVIFDQFSRPHTIKDFETEKRYAIIVDDDIYAEISDDVISPQALEVIE